MLRKTQHLFSPYRANYARTMPEARFSAVIETYQQGGNVKSALATHGVHASDFYRALRTDPVLGTQYDAAKMARADANRDEVVEIADSEDDPARARVRIDARRWQASVLNPQQYGDKLALEVDAGPSVVAAIAAAKSRLPCDLDATPITQVIDAPYVLLPHATDKQSAVLSKDDFFAD